MNTPPVAAPRLALLFAGPCGGLFGGSVVGAAEALYLHSRTRPTEYEALLYGLLLYGAVGVFFGVLLGGVYAAVGRAVGTSVARAWSGSFAAVAAALGVVVAEQRLPSGVEAEVVVASAVVLALVAAWAAGHLLAKTPLRVLLTLRGTAVAWLGLLAVGGTLSLSPAPGAADVLAPQRTQGDFADKPDVLVLVVDGLRADAVGATGGPTGATPAIDALAADGVVYTQAIAASGEVAPAFASLFTALPVGLHGVARDGDVLAEELHTLAEVLREGGYVTGGVVNDRAVAGSRGFDQGFDWYHLSRADPLLASESAAGLALYAPLRRAWEAHAPRAPVEAWYAPADRQLAEAARFWSANATVRSFLLVELREPAPPWFEHPIDGDATRLSDPIYADVARARYGQEVAAVDAAIGRLVDSLRRDGRYDDIAIILVGTHGETLGEGGQFGHGDVLADAVVHVPVVVKLPGGARAGVVVPWQVRQLDVAPTVLAIAGLPAPAGWLGVDLLDDWLDEDLALLDPPPPDDDFPAAEQPVFVAPTAAEHPGSRPALSEMVDGGERVLAVRAEGLLVVRRRGGAVPSASCFRAGPGGDSSVDVSDTEERCRLVDLADSLLGGWTGARPPKPTAHPRAAADPPPAGGPSGPTQTE